MTVALAWEPLAELLEDGLAARVEAHWQEVGRNKDLIPWSVDWAKYQALEDQSVLRILAARSPAGKLLGYNAFFVQPHLHYSTTRFAINDAIYLTPGERGSTGIGVRLILEAERGLKPQDGSVVKIVYHAKTYVHLGDDDSLERIEGLMQIEQDYGVRIPDDVDVPDTVGGILTLLGYAPEETLHAKVLGGR